jgi:hypothetical protein
MSEITFEMVAEAYSKTDTEIDALEAQVKELKKLQEKRKQWFADAMKFQGVQNVKTAYGTPYFSKFESVKMADWDAFYDWVERNDKREFLNHAVNKTAVLEMMGKDRTGDLPPGVSYSATRVVHFTK